jgi:hypothetical protein
MPQLQNLLQKEVYRWPILAAILGIVVAVFGIALLSPGAIAVGALLAVGGSAYIPYRCCSSRAEK